MLLVYLTLQATVLSETSLYKSAGNHSSKNVCVYELSAKISLKAVQRQDDIF